MTADRIAYCAPGTRLAASLALLLRGEQVAEVAESPILEGSTDVLIVTPPDFSDLPPVQLASPKLARCEMCRGFTQHYPWCPLELPVLLSHGPVVTLSGI